LSVETAAWLNPHVEMPRACFGTRYKVGIHWGHHNLSIDNWGTRPGH
jgi:hypothetical protein